MAMLVLAAANGYAQTFPQGERGPMRGAPRCSAGTVSGTYGFHMAGVMAGGQAPIAVLGIATYTPDGKITGRGLAASFGGQVVTDDSINGSFTINDDCSGLGEFTLGSGAKVTHSFVATAGGSELQLLNTDAGFTFAGVAKRTSSDGRRNYCTNGSILGRYGYRLYGTIQGVGAIALVGDLEHKLDAAGKFSFTGKDINSLNGMIVPRTLQGTYDTGGDCAGKGVYTDSLGQTINYRFVIVDGGQEIFLMGTDQGTTVNGIARRL
jgi:hypothetical protein